MVKFMLRTSWPPNGTARSSSASAGHFTSGSCRPLPGRASRRQNETAAHKCTKHSSDAFSARDSCIRCSAIPLISCLGARCTGVSEPCRRTLRATRFKTKNLYELESSYAHSLDCCRFSSPLRRTFKKKKKFFESNRKLLFFALHSSLSSCVFFFAADRAVL